jgi:hypothetical protein
MANLRSYSKDLQKHLKDTLSPKVYQEYENALYLFNEYVSSYADNDPDNPEIIVARLGFEPR